MAPKKADEQYSEEETIARAEAALKRMLNTPPKPHSEIKIGKRKAKASPPEKRARRPPIKKEELPKSK
jgi:hypothetical protein